MTLFLIGTVFGAAIAFGFVLFRSPVGPERPGEPVVYGPDGEPRRMEE